MTLSFDLQNVTRILFGEGKIAALAHLLPADEKVLLLYGGGSVKTNGVYDQVMSALGNRHVIPFGGVEPNPEYETIAEACRLAQKEKVTFVLGVGGGSVIDASKFLAAMIPITSGDAWDRLVAAEALPKPLPNGAILTLPATGSESNSVSVISRRSRGLKLPFRIDEARPQFAILDPATMKSLSRRQLENGVVDAVTHVLEQYLTQPANAPIQYGFSETLLTTLFETGPKLIERNADEDRETVMWAANQALNGLVGAGVDQDWSTHMIGHALTALYGIDHARTLSIIMPHLLRDQLQVKRGMLARYGRRVWNIQDGNDDVVAAAAISLTEQFFKRMGCPIRFADLPDIDFRADDIVDHLEKARQLPLGENRAIDAEDVRRILKAAA